MLAPYSTDAPIYHRPVGTITVIGLNCVIFVLTGMGEVVGSETSAYRWLILEYDRINPLQWITSAFMHGSAMHLIGNMIFLWSFGMIVEGKIGWKKFAALYIGLCLADGAIAQIPMFLMYGDTMGGALGASGVIFALMAIAMCWAPENDLNCILMIWYYIRSIDVPVFGFAMFYLILELLPLVFGGVRMSTQLLHLLGMAVGFPFAFYMLKHNLVDCEGWDIVSRWNQFPRNPFMILGRMFQNQVGREKTTVLAAAYAARSSQSGHDALQQIRANPSAFASPVANNTVVAQPPFSSPVPFAIPQTGRAQLVSRTQAIDSLRNAIESDQPRKASAVYRSILDSGDARLIRDDLLSTYIKLMGRHGHHLKTLGPLNVLVSRRSPYRNQACLRIAQIQLQLKDDPAAARATLAQMVQPMSSKLVAKRRQVFAACAAKVEKAPI